MRRIQLSYMHVYYVIYKCMHTTRYTSVYEDHTLYVTSTHNTALKGRAGAPDQLMEQPATSAEQPTPARPAGRGMDWQPLPACTEGPRHLALLETRPSVEH